MQAQDLKWRFDAVRRLADVQAIQPGQPVNLQDRRYVEPGILWRAFNRDLASQFGPVTSNASALDTRPRVVVLIDEIDKADPDLPNDLLVTLDERRFTVDDAGVEVEAPADLKLLVVITTNGERDLPPAFVRRCVTHKIANPKGEHLKTIARRHFPDVADDFLDKVAGTLDELARRAGRERRREPSVAEFLDAVRALRRLDVDESESDVWTRVTDATMAKAERRVAAGN
jgi:MoxR-like ATPase